ncbi:MAG: T9SS type A sorting domain-containing protein [Saprospiraceae bacterium]|nr:T9SS type A sorting domain-containing protein [Saprospiraceae bacterium]
MRLLLILSILLYPIIGIAQIEISSTQLPQVGDTILFAIDNLPAGIQVGPPGENHRWDFTTLQSPYTQRTVWQIPSTQQKDKLRPQIDIMLPLADQEQSFFETKPDGTILKWRTEASDPLKMNITGTVIYSKPEIYRRAPLKYGDQFEHAYAFSQTVSTEQLPQTILDALPITPDSFRINLTGERTDQVDAWGRVLIPGGFFDALREKRITTQRITLEAKLGNFAWQDISSLIPSDVFPLSFTRVTYIYYSNELPEPLAWIEMGEQEKFIQGITYAAPNQTTKFQDVNQLVPGVYAFPNPAIVNVRFAFTSLPPGEYDLTIMNILGLEAWKKRYFLQGNRTEKVDVSPLRKGTYLYSLRDAKGKTLTTKRLVIVRP